MTPNAFAAIEMRQEISANLKAKWNKERVSLTLKAN
jgi:hypothetical protein